MPFLPIIIRLLTLACRCLHCLCISGAALDDAEHSLTDLDFRDQLARRLFCVRYELCTTSFSLFAVRPVARPNTYPVVSTDVRPKTYFFLLGLPGRVRIRTPGSRPPSRPPRLGTPAESLVTAEALVTADRTVDCGVLYSRGASDREVGQPSATEDVDARAGAAQAADCGRSEGGAPKGSRGVALVSDSSACIKPWRCALARKQPQKKSKMKAVAAMAIATPSNA